MTIGIDIDNTITDNSKIIYKYIKIYDKSYDNYHDLPEDQYHEFLTTYIEDIMQNTDLKEGAKEAITYLHNNGHKIILITARNLYYSKNIINITLEYLKKHNIIYDKIIFGTKNNGQKGKDAFLNNIDIFIDDKESVLDDVAKYGIKCLKMGNKPSKYLCFNNWQDIINYIKSKGDEDGRKNY